MTSCCPNTNSSKKATCPVNGLSYPQVKHKTILHHLKKPWQYKLSKQAYYYCSDDKCDVIYFNEDTQQINADQIREKSNSKGNNKIICYCFNIYQKDLDKDLEACKEFVIAQTKKANCDCETQNPSGKCCLKNFKKLTRH